MLKKSSWNSKRKMEKTVGTICKNIFCKQVDIWLAMKLQIYANTVRCRPQTFFLKQISFNNSEKGRNFGIFIAFIAINIVGTILFYWLTRVPKLNKK